MLKKLQLTKIYYQKLKISAKVTAETLEQFFNQALTSGALPSNLKIADVTPVVQKQSTK